MRILFLVTEDWYFVSHRLAFAESLVARGHEVAIACSVGQEGNRIQSAGVQLFPIPFARQSLSPTSLFDVSRKVRAIIRDYRPDLIHNVALRPILVGNIATLGFDIPRINAIAGMGSTFTSTDPRMRIVALGLRRMLGWSLRRRNSFNVFQNGEDLITWSKQLRLPQRRTSLIRGAGVNYRSHFAVPELKSSPKVILFVGRLLEAKGIKVLVEASGILRKNGVEHILRIAGDVDTANADSVCRGWMEQLHECKEVEWLGRCDDVLHQMDQANIVVLPSFYGEGLPKVLLEAGLAQRAVVTTDMVGCREVVEHDRNGLLVAPRDPESLATALERLVNDDGLRSEFARIHNERIRDEFSSEKVFQQFSSLYDHILGRGKT